LNGPTYEEIFSIVCDNQKLYAAGTFSDNVDFDPFAGSDVKNSNGSLQPFLCMVNVNGTYFNTYTISPTWGLMYDLVLYNSSEISAVGEFLGTNADFDPGPAVYPLTSANFNQDSYVLRWKEGVINLIESQEGIESVSVFPVPFYGKLFINADEEIKEIELYNMVGAEIPISTSKNKNEITLNTELAEGVYFLKIHYTNGNTVNKKILCNK
jgi:hypothetical protein